MADASDSPNKKLLNLIKNGSKGLKYRDLKFFNKPAQDTVKTPLTEEELGIHALNTLSRLRFPLDNLWGNIFLKLNRDDRHLLFTGCSRGDGVSFVSFHLAMYMAMEHHLRVLYVDTDIERKATCDMVFYPTDKPGLASFFMEGADLKDLILETNVPNFSILPAGACATKVSSSNVITRMDLLDGLFAYGNEHFDMVVYDCKPVTISPLPLSFAKLAHQVFMICRYARSRREVCMLGIERFRQSGVDVSGMLLNDRQYPVPRIVYDFLK